MKHIADYILINGLIQTENPVLPQAEAVAVGGKVILCVGTEQECLVYAGEQTEIIDLGGRRVWPGLIDGHTHPECIAKTMWRVIMPRTYDVKELLEYVKAYCDEHSPEDVPYFFGENYFAEMFDSNGPNRKMIDEYVSDRPVRLQDFTDHACWYNTKALELMGITKDSPNPEGPMGKVEFIRDDQGEPTGWVLEASDEHEAGMYEALGWKPPANVTEETLTPFLDFLKDRGVTCLMDGYTEGEDAIKLFYDMDIAGRLNMYYEAACLLPSYEQLNQTIDMLRDWQAKYTTEHIHTNTIKFFIDGTNEMGDCCSLRPMTSVSVSEQMGHANITEDQLTDTLVRLNQEGIDFHAHVVCDGGFRLCCNAVERARRICGDRWNIYVTLAHCELMHPDDMKRVAELGIFIDWSTHWSGGYFGEAAIQYLGVDRWNTMYDFTHVINSGGIIGFSSDVFSYQEASRANPFFGMQIAMTRVDIEFPLDETRFPGRVRPPASAMLTAEELVRGYTINNAIRMRLDDRLGSIEAGKLANMVVLNQDVMNIAPSDVSKTHADIVIFEGKFRRPKGLDS